MQVPRDRLAAGSVGLFAPVRTHEVLNARGAFTVEPVVSALHGLDPGVWEALVERRVALGASIAGFTSHENRAGPL